MNEAALGVLKHLKRDDAGIYVFADPKTGKPFGSVKTAFLTALKKSKIPPLRFHDLRHTFATRLVATGVDLLTVKELLGHSNISMTMRYAHPSQENMRRAVVSLIGSPASRDGHQMDTKPQMATTASDAKSLN